MARVCTVCKHPERPAIDSAIVGGGAFEGIEKQFHVSRFALARHKTHVVELVALSSKVEKIAKADNLVDDILELTRHASEILEEARETQADLIIMGAKTRKTFAGHAPLTVAYNVVTKAKCPVLTVRG